MGRTKRSYRHSNKQSRHGAHKRMPENFHRFIWNGTRFASKLEIAWAFFFDGLKIQWEYEQRSVFLYKGTKDVTGYTPDFWLPKLGVFLEVKGRVLVPQAVERMERTAFETGSPVILAQGSPSRALNERIPDAGVLVHHPHPHGGWNKIELYHCPECQTSYFHQINNQEGVIGNKQSCNHVSHELSQSVILSVAGKRIPDSAIHLLSKRMNEI